MMQDIREKQLDILNNKYKDFNFDRMEELTEEGKFAHKEFLSNQK